MATSRVSHSMSSTNNSRLSKNSGLNASRLSKDSSGGGRTKGGKNSNPFDNAVIPAPSRNAEIYALQNEDFCYEEYPRCIGLHVADLRIYGVVIFEHTECVIPKPIRIFSPVPGVVFVATAELLRGPDSAFMAQRMGSMLPFR